MPWKSNFKKKGTIWQYTLVMLTVYMMIPLSHGFAIWDEKPLPTSIFEPIWWVVSFFSFTVPVTLDVYTLELRGCQQWPIDQKNGQRQWGWCDRWKKDCEMDLVYHTVGWFRNPAPSCRGSFHYIFIRFYTSQVTYQLGAGFCFLIQLRAEMNRARFGRNLPTGMSL